jgi:DNA mismatch repair protein MutS
MSNPEDVTPVRKQYLETKSLHPDCLLLFRLGDFYETFDEDAETISRELDIVLTSRPVGKGVRVPLAGIPYHALDNYLGKLIEKGYRVAIAEQVQEQKGGKIVFSRKVKRIVTPGTLMEPNLLPGDANNYLAAVLQEGEYAGVAYADISTGEFAATQLSIGENSSALRAELSRLRPAEVLLPENQTLPPGTPGHLSTLPGWRFEPGRTAEGLRQHFNVSTLEAFGLNHAPLAARAAGAILHYLKETEPSALQLLSSLRHYSLDEFMSLDAATRRNLELTETLRGEVKNSLLGVLDVTVTPMGKRLLRQWVNQPLLDEGKIRARQDGVAFFVAQGMVRAELRAALKPLGDLERVVNRIGTGNGQPRDLVALRQTLRLLPGIPGIFPAGEDAAPLRAALHGFSACPQTLQLLQEALADEPPATTQNIGIIRPGYAEELDGVIQASAYAREWINNLEKVERERTGIKTLKVGYNKVFGYYIELSAGQAANAPQEYLRKQTLVNAERYITPEMKEYEILVLNAEERIREIELRLFKEICSVISAGAGELLESARSLAELDCLAALGETAALHNYVRPEILSGGEMRIEAARHPVVERTLEGGKYVPNDIFFEPGELIRIITGPNMSGKSTVLRTTALLTLMAQMGSFVPARAAQIGLVDRIFTRIGAQDEIHAGQSTFMVEMIETANILHHATSKSLVILDEIGRGTSTYDGVSIAWAIVEYLHNHPHLRAKTLFATHYHELTQLADLLPGVRNYNVAVMEQDGKVVFLHEIIPGGADRSYGIHVAQLAGLPRPVIQRAGEIMAELEKTSGRAVKINPLAAQQIALFPETNPLLEELNRLDTNSLSPIEALNKLFEWQKTFGRK